MSCCSAVSYHNTVSCHDTVMLQCCIVSQCCVFFSSLHHVATLSHCLRMSCHVVALCGITVLWDNALSSRNIVFYDNPCHVTMLCRLFRGRRLRYWMTSLSLTGGRLEMPAVALVSFRQTTLPTSQNLRLLRATRELSFLYLVLSSICPADNS